MRPVDELLIELRGLGVKLWVESDRLRFRAPKGTMTETLTDELRRCKAEIMALLGQAAGPGIQPIADRDDYELSHAQRRLWVLSHLGGASVAYNVGLRLLMQGSLNEEACAAALQSLVDRHESLRTTFRIVAGEPRQIVHRRFDVALERMDFAADPSPEQLARNAARREAAAPFDLETAPPLRATLIKLAEQDHVLLLTLHHIITDGWSNNIIVREFAACYRAACRGSSADLPPLKFHYRDFAAWQNRELAGPAMAVHRDYWHQKLAGPFPALNLPTDFPRPAVQTYGGRALTFELGPERAKRLAEFTRRQNASLFMVLLAALKVLLYRYTGQDDVIVGAPIAGQPLAGADDQVGCYVNTLAFRDRVQGHLPFDAFLQHVKKTATDAYEHQIYPFDRLVEDLNLARDTSRSPIVDVMLILQSIEHRDLGLDDLRVRSFFQEQDTTVFDLVIDVEETEDDLHYNITYNMSLFVESTIARLAGHFEQLLDSILSAPATPIGRLNLLTGADRLRLVEGFHHAASDYPREKTIVDLFEAQVAATPDNPAVTFGDRELSYRELNDRANHLARRLIDEHEVRPGELIAVCLDRSEQVIVSLLGILKSGAAYVPLDPEYPDARLRHMLADSRCRLVLTEAMYREQIGRCLPEDGQPAVVEPGRAAAPAAADPPRRAAPDDPAYVIYTSGSTGRPKGCVVTHRNVVRLMKNSSHPFDFGPHDVWVVAHSFCFDFSVWEMYGALLYGGRVVVAPRDEVRDVVAFGDLLRRHRVTVLNQTPAAFYNLVRAEVGRRQPDLGCHLRYVIFGGDRLDPGRLQPWTEIYPPTSVRLVNMYGITETTVHVTFGPLDAETIDRADGRSPIGVPLPETTVYVCNEQMQLQPIGVVGEMYVGGSGVSRGYLNRAELTAERFIESPFRDGEILYKTGDLGRWTEAGTLEHWGRNDDQVQVRGFRVELSEVEAALIQHPAIEQSVVVAEQDGAGDGRLVAWYVPHAGHDFAVSELREHARQTLPDYMIPSLFQRIDRLPLTSNGKVDRRALPASDRDRPERVAEFVAPRSPTERCIAELWREVLEMERVGVHDDFFELGGHSLKATMLAARMQHELNVQLSLLDIFRHPTIAGLAETIAEHDTSPGPEIRPLAGQPPINGDEFAPLSAEELEMLNE